MCLRVPIHNEFGSWDSGWTCRTSLEVVPIVDRHDHIFPEEGHHVSLTPVFFQFHVLGEGPQDHEALHHAAVLEPVVDDVRVVRADLLEESLEVVYWWPCLAFDTTYGGRDALLLPLLATLNVLLGALEGDAGRRRLATARDCLTTA
jgi:hypothetical protein